MGVKHKGCPTDGKHDAVALVCPTKNECIETFRPFLSCIKKSSSRREGGMAAPALVANTKTQAFTSSTFCGEIAGNPSGCAARELFHLPRTMRSGGAKNDPPGSPVSGSGRQADQIFPPVLLFPGFVWNVIPGPLIENLFDLHGNSWPELFFG